MRTRQILMLIAFACLSALSPSVALATLSGQSIVPVLYANWEWEQRPIIGNVTRIEFGRVMPDAQNGKATEMVFLTSDFTSDAQDKRVEKEGPDGVRSSTQTYDSKGRLTRAEGRMFDGSAGQMFTFVESIRYDEKDNVTEVETKRDDMLVQKLTGKTTPLPGGGKRTQFEHKDSRGRAVVRSYYFDAKGLMTRHESTSNGKPGLLFIISRNEKGDVAAFKLDEKGAPTEYAYEYDKQGNWTRRETFRTEGGARNSTMVEFRRITYGTQPPAAPNAK